MKITVLSILILMLMAGLAMVQIDANTEDQIQVLRETEMLTTQGLGVCQKLVTDADGLDEDPCGDKNCRWLYWTTIWVWEGEGSQRKWVPKLVDVFGKRTAVAYNKCEGQSFDKDCFTNNNIPPQKCAEETEYLRAGGINCGEVFKGPTPVMVPDVQEFWGCAGGGGGGGSGGTSS